jgi:hypothetical protein
MATGDSQPDLIPYASHVSHGTGRTPIGIIMIAASHLMLGAAICAVTVMVIRAAPLQARTDPKNVLWFAAAGALAVSMLVGGMLLLLKGSAAWGASIVSFTCVALAESVAGGLGAWLAVSGKAQSSWWGIAQTVIAMFLTAMTFVVLSYLGGANARRTFGLQPGETVRVVRWLPKLVVAAFVLAVVAGVTVGNA